MLNSLWVKNKYKSRIQIETWPTYMINKYFSYLYLSGILYWRIEKIKLFVAAEKSKASSKNAEKGKDVWGTFQERWCCFLENWLWFDVWWFLISVILWTRAMHPSKKCFIPGVIWISSCSLLQTSVGNSTLTVRHLQPWIFYFLISDIDNLQFIQNTLYWDTYSANQPGKTCFWALLDHQASFH